MTPTPADPGAIDLEPYKARCKEIDVPWRTFRDDWLILIAAVEALRERVEMWHTIAESNQDEAEVAEARVVELAGALDKIAHSGPVDAEGKPNAEAGWAWCYDVAETVLSATPVEAMERAKAKDAVIDQADEIYTRLLVLKLVGKFVPPDDAVALEFNELGNRLAKLDTLRP